MKNLEAKQQNSMLLKAEKLKVERLSMQTSIV